MTSKEFIYKYRKRLTSGAMFFNPDTSMMPKEKFDAAKCRILLCFPTPASVKTVSSTAAAFNDYIIEHCPDTFVDFAYVPEGEDISLYDDNRMPYAIGNITHLDASHFDIVGFSISVLSDIIGACSMLKSFEHCDKPIPLFWSDRKDLSINECPIVYFGGITAVCADVCFGKVYDKEAFGDFMYLGSCEKTDILTSRLIEAKQSGFCTRKQSDHDVPGYAHEDIENFVEKYPVSTVQDYIESLFDLQNIYQPQAYEVKFNKSRQIISNIKINPKARDFITPYYPHIMHPDLGVGRTIINANGDMVGTAQTQVSEGAHVGSNWIRTDRGLTQIKDLCQSIKGDSPIDDVSVDTTLGKRSLYHQFNQGVKPYRRFILKSGITIGLTDEHPVEQWHIGDPNTSFVRADSLQPGDFFMTKKSDVFGNYPMTTDEAEFLGRMLGDGSYNLYNDSREGHDLPVHKMYLACAWSEADYCENLLKRASINYTKDENRDRHCRFWIKETDLKGRSMRDFWTFNKFYTRVDNKPSIKYVPDAAFMLSKECMRAFLKGYHDADGCTSTKAGLSKVSFDCCHESIIDIIQQFLLMVGIPSRKHFCEKSRIADEAYGFYDTTNEHWSLFISSEYFDRFNALGVLKKATCRSELSKEHLPISDNARDVVSSCDITTEQRSHVYAAIRRGSFTKSMADICGISYPKDIVFDEIVAIEYGEDVVYDLSVNDVERLIANGCSVHNCSASGCCSFKVAKGTRIWEPNGLVKIEESETTQVLGGFSDRFEGAAGVVKQTSSEVYKVTTKDGHELNCDIEHKFLVVSGDSLLEKKTYELAQGDVILRRLCAPSYPEETNPLITPEFCEFLGFMHGDGCFDNKNKRWKIYMNEGALVHYEFLFRKYVPTAYKTRVHYKSKNTIIYVIEGNAVDFGFDIAAVSCTEAYVPEFLFHTSKENICAYLRGIFQAAGWFNNHLGLTFSKKYIQDISLLLSYVGIDNTVRCNDYYAKHLCPGHKVSHFVQVSKPFQQKFIDEIGFWTKNYPVGSIGNKTKANLPNINCIKEAVRGEYVRDEARERGLGQFFETPSHLISDEEWRNLPEKFIPNGVRLLVHSGSYVTDVIDEVTPTGEVSEMYDVVETETHMCIYGEFLTHNCSEGNYTGGWVEKTSEQILKEVWETKKYNAGYKYKPYSFNANYITNYKGMLLEFIKIYPKVTFINMRMEELGRDPDAIKMMKLIGSNRISAPIEGLSPRIQNNLLNKCLSEESLTNFMDDMVHQKMTDIKVGGIFTGYEEDEDFQWICDFVDKFKQRAAKEGGNFPFRLKCTPLVHYPLTPIEYIERKSAFRSYNGDRWLTDEWYDKFKEHQVFFKVNGFRYSTFLEQSIVDLGRSLTPLMYEHFIKNSTPIYSLRTIATDEFIADLKKFIDPAVHFADRDPEHYISPCHRIHIELMGSYIPRARRLARYKKEGRIFENPMDIRCLKTYDGAKTMCQHNCIVKDPLKIYTDVTMDENGELHGDYTNLTGCERCQTVEQRKNRLVRPTPQTANSDDVIAAPRKAQVQKIRFILRRSSDYDVLNPNNTAHTFLTKFLQLSDKLLHEYHSVVCHNMFWQAGPEFKYFASGFQVVDTMWSSNVISEVKSLVPEVNKNLQTVQVVSAFDILRDDKLTITDYNVFYFETNLPKDLFDAARMNYKGEIKVESGTSMGFSLEQTQDKTLKAPVYVTKGKTVGFFYIPAKYNPIVYMSGFLSTGKKMGFDAIADAVEFSCVSTVRESHMICKNCGNEKALVSLSTGKPISFGLDCMCKAFLTSKIKG